jgi:hypothetical protein
MSWATALEQIEKVRKKRKGINFFILFRFFEDDVFLNLGVDPGNDFGLIIFSNFFWKVDFQPVADGNDSIFAYLAVYKVGKMFFLDFDVGNSGFEFCFSV